MSDPQLTRIVAALRKGAAANDGALHLDHCLTDRLLDALDHLAGSDPHAAPGHADARQSALSSAVARGDVINLADRRMVINRTAGSDPEGAA